jgi:putative ABC transport system substrate-binding protein
MIGRRGLLVGCAGAALAWSSLTSAQDSRIRRIGLLFTGFESAPTGLPRVAAFTDGLASLGWVEGRNVSIRTRFAGTDEASYRMAAHELVATDPELIVVNTVRLLLVLRQINAAIPTIFVNISEPVAQGLVQNLAHPGGNVTGLTNYEFSIGGKWVELLHEIAPGITRIAVIGNPDTSDFNLWFAPIADAARRFSLTCAPVRVHTDDELASAIATAGRERDNGIVFMSGPFITNRGPAIIALAARYAVPATYAFRQLAAAGGLASYGLDLNDEFRRAAGYADRILKGERPGDMPVQAPNKFELVINLKTAKSLGLAIPQSLLARADEVIE